MFYLNCTTGLFRSEDVRLAVNHAIDSKALFNKVYKDLALPSATVVSPFDLESAEADLEPIAFNPGKARKLLEALDTRVPSSCGPLPTCPKDRTIRGFIVTRSRSRG